MADKFIYQQGCVGVPFTGSAWFTELACRDKELADRGDAVGSEERELQSFLKGERELKLADNLLDEHGVSVGHRGEGTAGGIGECLESCAEAVIAKEGAKQGVEG